jgi:DNA-binding MarR family transcriptional regulator
VTKNSSIKECPLLLIYSSTRVLLQIYDELLAAFDLTYTQYLTLLCVNEKKVCSIRDIGEKLSLDSGTLSPLIKKLETRGLVKRTRAFEDERRLNVCLTSNASKLLLKTDQIRNAVIQELPLSKIEVKTLKDILQNLQVYKKDRRKSKNQKHSSKFSFLSADKQKNLIPVTR